jgi:hypothetical protein
MEAGVEGFSLACAHPNPVEQIEALGEIRTFLTPAMAVP